MDTYTITRFADNSPKAWRRASTLDGGVGTAVETAYGGGLARGTRAAPHNGGQGFGTREAKGKRCRVQRSTGA
jgi:hypothetical protein